MTEASQTLGDRAGALLAAVAPTGAHALVCYSSARHFLTESDPVWWLTRLRPLGPCAAAIDPEGGVELFVSPPSDVARARERVPGASVRAGGIETLEEWSVRHGLTGREVALWGGHKLVGRTSDALGALLGGFHLADELCEDVSRCRAPHEVATLESASRLAEEGMAALLTAARPGAAEFEVAAAVRRRLRDLGAGDSFLLLSSSRHNLALHPPTERLLAGGDVVLLELSPSTDGMFTQLCRTVAVGTPPQRLVDDYAVLTESLVAGAAACRPGTAVAEVVTTMDAVLADAGYEAYCRPPHMRARGHGLGLASSRPGDVTRDSERLLVEGDVFVLHPNQYLPGSGYLLCGEPLVVTDDGGRSLTGGFADLWTVPA